MQMKERQSKDTPVLSCSIITFNEERIIEKTLSSIHNWVDEIIVVDSFSTDNTINILEMFNVKLFQQKWDGYSKQKNYAVSKCTGDWILVLDADEVVSEKLKAEIVKAIKKPGLNTGFSIPRKLYIGKKWIKYGGYYPDYQLRLFKKNAKAEFLQRAVHESISLNGKVGYLKNPLEHYAYASINDYKKSLCEYAVLASKEIKNKTYYLPLLRAAWSFLFRYIFRLGFLEGKLGFNLAKAYSQYVFKKYKLAMEKMS